MRGIQITSCGGLPIGTRSPSSSEATQADKYAYQVEISAVFTTLTPTEWQAPPEWMNFHYLVRAEQCPRSAALRHATYSQLWSRRDYPDKPSLAGLAGMVMHRAIARIIRALADGGVDSF